MRILQIRFKNLNSLTGEWLIDLTHPAYISEGIFAITGPTGAGKSTILDAICLALYGRTPRLNKITKASNEIMARQTAECFAEVSFETQKGRFRCHWSQHRARKKSDGELQAPKHEIAHADSGAIYETKLKGVAEQIEAVTGMDFERFTRSMLLAQGGFAAFLQAAPDERAPILEQITGTEIYSHISIRVHELRQAERKKLDILLAELAGMQLLSEEDEQQLKCSLAELLTQELALTEQLQLKTHTIAWAENMVRLQAVLELLAQQQQELNHKITAFAPEQSRLNAAMQALELAGDYSALSLLRQSQANDQSSRFESLQAQPELEEKLQQTQVAMQQATLQLEENKAAQQQLLPVLRQVRELDLKISEKAQPIVQTQNLLAELSQTISTLTRQQQHDQAALNQQQTELATLHQQLVISHADAGLVEHLTGIQERCAHLQLLNTQLNAKTAASKLSNEQLTQATAKSEQAILELQNHQQLWGELQGQFNTQQQELDCILATHSLADWRARITQISSYCTGSSSALDGLTQLSQAQQALVEQQQQWRQLTDAQNTVTTDLKTQSAQQQALQQEMELLETQLVLLKKIEDLEHARSQLQDGEACPLCGATEHPYAQGNIPVPDVTQQRLTLVRNDLKIVNQAVSVLQVKLATQAKDLEQLMTAQHTQEANINAAQQQIIQACAQLAGELTCNLETPALEAIVTEFLTAQQQQFTAVHAKVAAAEALENTLNSLRQQQEQAKDKVVTAELALQTSLHAKQTMEAEVARLQGESQRLAEHLSTALAGLQRELQPFSNEALSIEQLETVLTELSRRRQHWQARQTQKLALEHTSAALTLQIGHQQTQLQQTEIERSKQQQYLASLEQERHSLQQQRQVVFADKHPDSEELRQAQAIRLAEQTLEQTRVKLQDATLQPSQLHSKIKSLEQAIAEREQRLQIAEAEFKQRLTLMGFSTETDFQAATLSEEQRQQLAQQAQQLAEAQTALNAKYREHTLQLASEQRKQLSDQPLDTLKAEHAVLLQTQKNLQQDIGGLQQKLQHNETLKQQHQQHAESIAAQKSETQRWEQLHELIGSADGKKYRNFAQGLTFELMIAHANRQLHQMSDRYLLTRNTSHPLELSVVDNYQAGEIRSTKNLSGGEGFIVSLALALGLSNMASKNVRVDSLFLDEGFGTLDEDALDTALETLAGLQQTGKLIGVISHVAALKERISQQIHVSPQAGGRSVISGPGCAKV